MDLTNAFTLKMITYWRKLLFAETQQFQVYKWQLIVMLEWYSCMHVDILCPVDSLVVFCLMHMAIFNVLKLYQLLFFNFRYLLLYRLYFDQSVASPPSYVLPEINKIQKLDIQNFGFIDNYP